jgi:hypothetical protein
MADEADEMTPEEREAEEKELATHRGVLAWVLAQGLRWSDTSKNDLIHPDDAELTAWRDPHTEKVLLSPKLGQRMIEELRRAGIVTPASPPDTL